VVEKLGHRVGVRWFLGWGRTRVGGVVWGRVGGDSFEPGGGRAYSDVGGRWCLCRNEGRGLVGKCTRVAVGGSLAHGGLGAGWAFGRGWDGGKVLGGY